MDRIIMHIDVNNAFLSWTAVSLLEAGFKYDIRDSYAVIGGDEEARHGIVLAKSMKAKKMGINTAETLYSARRKCRVLKVYKPDYKMYKQKSNAMFEYLRNYTPDIEVASIDECYLDYSSVRNLYGDPIKFAYRLKDEIYNNLGFTVNIGVANNKLCAKMASDFTKPNKVHTLFMNEIEEKMYPLFIGDLFGIGKKTTEKLQKLNINTIADLAHTDPNFLYKYFKNQASNMILWAKGIDDSPVINTTPSPSSISNEITLDHDVLNKEELYKYLEILSKQVSLRLRKEKKYASVVVVVLKDVTFRRKQHQKKITNATNITKEIFDVAKEILDEMYLDVGIRLIGLRLDGLKINVTYQTSLFEDVKERSHDEKIDSLIDEIQNKYGVNTIQKGVKGDSKIEFK